MINSFSATLLGMKSWDSGTCFADKPCEGKAITDEIWRIVSNVANDLLILAGIIFVVMIVIGGVKYVTAAGNAENAKKALDTIIKAITGAAISAISAGIVAFVSDDIFTSTNCKVSIKGEESANIEGICKNSGETVLTGIMSLIFYIIGALSIVMIVIGGIQYMTASGNPEKTKKARHTIVYAVIGLAVAILANTIASFVMGKIA